MNAALLFLSLSSTDIGHDGGHFYQTVAAYTYSIPTILNDVQKPRTIRFLYNLFTSNKSIRFVNVQLRPPGALYECFTYITTSHILQSYTFTFIQMYTFFMICSERIRALVE